MKNTVIEIPSRYKYISEVPQFQVDVPDNVLIDKNKCGCGFTVSILQNNIDYVIAVPFIKLATNKYKQSLKDKDTYPHKLFTVDGNTDFKELLDYCNNTETSKKIIVTYDSLPKLKKYIDTKTYKLFIDECHKILDYAGLFKPKVIHNLIKELPNYRAYVLTTATPTREKYLPKELKELDKIKLQWSNNVAVSFKHKRLNQNQLSDSLISVCLSYLRGDKDGNVYIFFNSGKNITKIIKTLKKVYKYSHKDIDVICANTDKNRRSLRTLGTKWEPQDAIKFDENNEIIHEYKKVTFVTSTAFEGQDFLDPSGKTLIVCDGKLEHTKLDISTQVSQIVGRLRNSKYKTEVKLLWTYSPINEYKTLEEYEKYVENLSLGSDAYLKDYSNVVTERAKLSLIGSVETDIFFIDNSEDEHLDLIKNPNASNCLLNNYEAFDMVYSTSLPENHEYFEKQDKVTTSLSEIFKGRVDCNYETPNLSPADKKLIGKVTNFARTAKEYVDAMIQLVNKDKFQLEPQEIERLKNFTLSVQTDSHYEILLDYIKVFGIKDLSEHSFKLSYIKKKLNTHRELKELPEVLRKRLNLKIGDSYTKKYIKEKLREVYDELGITSKPSATKIKLLYIVKNTTRDGENCFKIISKL